MEGPSVDFLMFIFSESLLPISSYATGILAGIQNLSYFRFWSSVGPEGEKFEIWNTVKKHIKIMWA